MLSTSFRPPEVLPDFRLEHLSNLSTTSGGRN